MKLSAATPWTVVLLVEDDTDGIIIQKIAQAAGVRARIDWIPANGSGNLKRKGPKYIAVAKDEAGKCGCVAVVLDKDSKDPGRDEPHRSIAAICRRESVPLVLAHEAIEAWLLADQGVCSWLGIKGSGDTAAHRDPKQILGKAFEKKLGHPYNKRKSRVEVARRVTGPALSRNASLAAAFNHLGKCGVLKEARS